MAAISVMSSGTRSLAVDHCGRLSDSLSFGSLKRGLLEIRRQCYCRPNVFPRSADEVTQVPVAI